MSQGQCEFIKDNGERCGGPVIDEHGRCIAHTEVPKYVEAREAGRSRGGRTLKERLEVDADDLPEVNLGDVDDLLALQQRAAQVALAILERDPANLKAARELSLISKRASDVVKLNKLAGKWQEIEDRVRELTKR